MEGGGGRGILWPNTGVSNYHTNLVLAYKGLAIKGLVVPRIFEPHKKKENEKFLNRIGSSGEWLF